MDFLNDYIVLVVMGICVCVGFCIKHLIPTDNINKYIPTILAILGVALNLWNNAFAVTPGIVLGGLVSGLAATGCYEAVHNFFKNIGGMKK